MKIYKHYFDKRDTPFKWTFQAKKKYHTVWKRQAYTKFLGHAVIKIKLFGIFTIYQRKLKQSRLLPSQVMKNIIIFGGLKPMKEQNTTAKENTVTAEQIDALMKDAEISISTVHDKCTVVSVKLKNGFVITESSACVDKANYNLAVGTDICMERIKNKLWQLEGYFLQKAIHFAKEQAEKQSKQTAKERAQQELDELTERLGKLHNFLSCPHITMPFKLNEAQRRLLGEQLETMEEYQRILSARLSIWED